MRDFLTAAALTIATLPHAHAFHKGFNIASQRPDGSCKVQADWEVHESSSVSLARVLHSV